MKLSDDDADLLHKAVEFCIKKDFRLPDFIRSIHGEQKQHEYEVLTALVTGVRLGFAMIQIHTQELQNDRRSKAKWDNASQHRTGNRGKTSPASDSKSSERRKD